MCWRLYVKKSGEVSGKGYSYFGFLICLVFLVFVLQLVGWEGRGVDIEVVNKGWYIRQRVVIQVCCCSGGGSVNSLYWVLISLLSIREFSFGMVFVWGSYVEYDFSYFSRVIIFRNVKF